MKTELTFEDRALRKALRYLRRRLHDNAAMMDGIGAAWADRVRLGFHDGRDPWGDPWAPLKPSTIARRRNRSDQPLRDTGRLRSSIYHRAGRDWLEVGLAAKYAGTHQFGARKGQYGRTRRGAPIPWGDVPARPMLPASGRHVLLPREWQTDARDAVVDHLKRGLPRA